MIAKRTRLRPARRGTLLAGFLLMSGCGSPRPLTTTPADGRPPSLGSNPSLGLDVRRLDAKPRLALVARDGDPFPAIVIAVATETGPASTIGLGAIVEARLREAGQDASVRTDRDAFRIVSRVPPARVGALLSAVAAAFAKPIAPGSPELTAAKDRLDAARRHPLDAPELAPIVACTGALGALASELALDPTVAAGARELETARASALVAARTSIGAVGPSAFCDAVVQELERSSGWIAGSSGTDLWPTADSLGTYVLPLPERASPRLAIATRVGDGPTAAAAAARLGAARSKLLAKLSAQGEPWRVTEIAGVARPSGGCVALSLEATDRASASLENDAARAVAIVRAEIAAELAEGTSPAFATRVVLAAGDSREAAARAAWWAFSTPAPSSQPITSIVLGASSAPAADRERLRAALDSASARIGKPVAERRVAVERGQGEAWVLLASSCGTAEETAEDAGRSALGALAIAEAHRGDDVILEPWITPDGIGVLAHAAPRDDRETRAELARRVGDAAGRALGGTTIAPESLSAARAVGLDFLERSGGRQAAALDAFLLQAAPDHPSWIEPAGLFTRVASAGLDPVRERWQILANGPLRVAIVANGDASDAGGAAEAIERWIGPRLVDRACRVAPAAPPRPGRYEARLAADAPLAQAIVAAQVPPWGANGHELALVATALLEGPSGALAKNVPSAASSSVRLLGGARAAFLALDVRAPADTIEQAAAEARAALVKLSFATDGEVARAASSVGDRITIERADPRARIAELWRGGSPPPTGVTAGALHDLASQWFKDSATITVVAKPARAP